MFVHAALHSLMRCKHVCHGLDAALNMQGTNCPGSSASGHVIAKKCPCGVWPPAVSQPDSVSRSAAPTLFVHNLLVIPNPGRAAAAAARRAPRCATWRPRPGTLPSHATAGCQSPSACRACACAPVAKGAEPSSHDAQALTHIPTICRQRLTQCKHQSTALESAQVSIEVCIKNCAMRTKTTWLLGRGVGQRAGTGGPSGHLLAHASLAPWMG